MIKFGKVFSDNIISGKSRWFWPQARWRGWGARITIFYVLLISLFFLLVGRLFHLTVIKGAENRSLSEGNRVREVTIHAPRGLLFDRRNLPLVTNIPALRISHDCEKTSACRTELVTLDNLSTEKNPVSGNYYERDYLRQYTNPYETAHVLGNLGEIGSDELANPYYTYQGYAAGDWMGRSGLEASFERILRGTNGKELIEVDAKNQKIRTLGKVDPIPGSDLHLTLDLDLQKVAYEALGENPGAVIVTKPKTGEVLALVSTPSYNPNLLHAGLTPEEYQALTTESAKPLFNRAVSGVYPPGSVFKLIPAIAALETKKITPETLIEDVGVLRVGEFSFANWYFSQYGKTEGQVDVVKAIARSNDIFFYKLGEALGPDEMASWSRLFGLGKKTGVELAGEAEGIVPDRQWRKKIRNEDWYLGDTYHLAIGQGDLAVTPLQVNLWTSIVADGGILCRPTLIKSQISASPAGRSNLITAMAGSRQSDKSNMSGKSQNCKNLGIRKETLKLVTEGMQRACYRGPEVEYQGTGWPLFDFTVLKETLTGSTGKGETRTVPVACKTGTAEFGDSQGRTHAWFTAFAPLSQALQPETDAPAITGDPEIAVTVLVEKGGEGSSVAGPIVKQILAEWFKR